MQLHARFVIAAFGVAAAFTVSGCGAPNGTVAPSAAPLPFGPGWIAKDGVIYHKPHYMLGYDRRMRKRPVNLSNEFFYYRGGPVLVTPKVYLIFWGYQQYGDPDGVKPLLEKYLQNMGGSAHNNIYTQYYETTGSSATFSKTYITNPSSQYGGAWMDNNPVPRYPSDAQVAQQALDGVAQFGYDPNGEYVVATPHGRNTEGFGHPWCAYHGNVSYGTSGLLQISYTNFAYVPEVGGFCGAYIIKPPPGEKGYDEGVTIVEGHEEGESVTDKVPSTGWTDDLFNEIGDACAWLNIANDPFGRYSFTMQPMFSDATGTCVHSY